MFATGPDGEYFVDEVPKSIPTRDTWDNLSVRELYEVKSALETKFFEHPANGTIAKQLSVAIDTVTQLISSRESAAF